MKFFIVDAFTDQLFGGNPAGVVLLPNGADFPDDETMRKTAAELRYSETAFIKALDDGTFNIRYFTPAAEVDLCGHATIASFFALVKKGYIKPDSVYTNHTLAGKLQIKVTSNSVLMDMGKAEAFGVIDEKGKLDRLYSIMGLPTEVPKARGEFLYPELVSTGLTDIMLAVEDETALAAISPDFPALSKISKEYNVTGVHAFTLNTSDNAVHCRNFAPLYDIDEEAATGTSNGALTYYLYKRGLIEKETENTFIQGEGMGRPSKISSLLTLENEEIRIQVGGMAVIVAEGEINL
ncbi:MAG: PhzF family phenazine biosynthesis protein [Clostridia bacterium]|nr:PhzF family phenazine biosynthesis protein [Clostridia bacterium]